MLTPKGEHFSPCSHRVMLMGESVSTESQPSKLCSWILFPCGLQVKRKSGRKFSAVTPSKRVTCDAGWFSTAVDEDSKNQYSSLRKLVQAKHKSQVRDW